jgi:hypothetical protein
MAVETAPRPNEAMNPLFDPHRDGVPEMPLTARICGDPIPDGASSWPPTVRGKRVTAGETLSDPLRQRHR